MTIINLDLYDFPKLYTNKEHMSKLASISGGTSLFTKEELNLLPDSDFALVIKEGAASTRKFPVVDKAHAYVSALMFNKTQDSLPPTIRNKVAANIVKGVAGHTITDNTITKAALTASTKLATIATAVEKRSALKDSDFALVIKTAEETRRLYPIDSEAMCKKAAEYFEENYMRMPVDFRHKFAFALTTKIASEEYDVPIPDIVHSYHSNSFNPLIEHELIAREQSAKEASIKQAYALLRKQYTKAHPIKIATLLRGLDKEAGLESSRFFKNAYAAVFGKDTSVKQASDVTIQGNYQFDPSTLQTMPYEKFQGMFTPEDFTELQASPVEGYAALPTIYQEQVANIAQGAM
ncbi:MAG: hypothetical protein DRH24_13570 [Deltaproteobacteria bacterium]|nr:MAG: hypothetical protein DRH24_13570 [Deltaproteobacteria bacterium]